MSVKYFCSLLWICVVNSKLLSNIWLSKSAYLNPWWGSIIPNISILPHRQFTTRHPYILIYDTCWYLSMSSNCTTVRPSNIISDVFWYWRTCMCVHSTVRYNSCSVYHSCSKILCDSCIVYLSESNILSKIAYTLRHILMESTRYPICRQYVKVYHSITHLRVYPIYLVLQQMHITNHHCCWLQFGWKI